METTTASKKDEELENANYSDRDLEEYLGRIFDENMEQIQIVSLIIHISSITAMLSFLVFLIVLSARMNMWVTFSWFYVHIPSFLSIASLTVMMNMYLRLKDIIDNAERKDKNGIQVGTIFSYFCLNIVALSAIVYIVFLSMKLDNGISSEWNDISVPLYIIFGVSFFYCIFISPAFFQNRLYIEIILISCYILLSLSFAIMITFKLDHYAKFSWGTVFSPVYTILFCHLCYSVWGYFQNKDKIFHNACLSIAVVFCIISVVLIHLKADMILRGLENWTPVILFIIAYCTLIGHKVYTLLFGEKEEEKGEVLMNNL